LLMAQFGGLAHVVPQLLNEVGTIDDLTGNALRQIDPGR
jgi:hypothetical protein